MEKVIIYRKKGSNDIAVFSISPEILNKDSFTRKNLHAKNILDENASYDDILQYCTNRLSENNDVFIVEKSSIPTIIDNNLSDYQKALRYANGEWSIDLDCMKSLHLEKLRNLREIKFKEMGFPFKLDDDLEKAVIPVEKRRILNELRDIPQNFLKQQFSNYSEILNYKTFLEKENVE